MMRVYSLILSISSIVGVALAIPLLSVFDLAGAMFLGDFFFCSFGGLLSSS